MSQLKKPPVIGGYFEFELLNKSNVGKTNNWFNSGRSAFAFLLGFHKVKLIQIPKYTCDVILEPLNKMGIKYSFYSITKNLLPDYATGEIDLKVPILINNYFGILDRQLESYKSNPLVIIDNSQALYSNATGGLGSFNSFRKFVGIPDGAAARINKSYDIYIEDTWPTFKVTNQLSHLFGRIEEGPEAYYKAFENANDSFRFKQIECISEISKRTFVKLDHENNKNTRIKNFNYLHEKLGNINELSWQINGEVVPLVYPLLISNGSQLRKNLISNKIFTPTYWPNSQIEIPSNCYEEYLVKNLVALPIDQRYGVKEMDVISKYVLDFDV
tara:strand:- start:1392 stop:2378 length:987 start_codon:yes stop_codon:yes gene_type:complete